MLDKGNQNLLRAYDASQSSTLIACLNASRLNLPQTIAPCLMPSTSAGTFHSQHAFQNQTAHSQSLPSTQGPSLTLTLWILEGIQKYEAWLNYDLFPPGTCKPGDIVEVRAAGENGPNNGAPESAGGTTTVSSTASEMGTGGGETEATTDFSRVGAAAKSKDAIRLGNGGGNPGDTRKEEGQRFLFVVREMDQELRQKQPNLQVPIPVFHCMRL